MDWCRLWHGTPNDPKFGLVAQKANQPTGVVLAVFVRMMDRASQASDRGCITGWDDEEEAYALGFAASTVRAVREAMQGRLLQGDRLSGWDKRQPKRERPNDNSSERVKAFRERQAGVTPCNAPDGQETPRLDKSRVDKKPEPPPIVPPRGDDTQDFDRFWQAYPRRPQNPRKPAEEKFRAALKKGAKPGELVAGAERYAAEMQQAGKVGTELVCQAKTWLHQERWKDTTGPPRPAANTSAAALQSADAALKRRDHWLAERERQRSEEAGSDDDMASAQDMRELMDDLKQGMRP